MTGAGPASEDGGAAAPPPERPGAAAHDLVATLLGGAALVLLVASPWLVDRSGPDPFYKGPLIFPMIVLGLAASGAAPAAWRLFRPAGPRDWVVDGRGFPVRAAALFAVMCGFAVGILVVGLQAASFLGILAGLAVVGYRRPLRALAIALGLTLLIHLAFRTFLDIWFPATMAGDWLAAGWPGG